MANFFLCNSPNLYCEIPPRLLVAFQEQLLIRLMVIHTFLMSPRILSVNTCFLEPETDLHVSLATDATHVTRAVWIGTVRDLFFSVSFHLWSRQNAELPNKDLISQSHMSETSVRWSAALLVILEGMSEFNCANLVWRNLLIPRTSFQVKYRCAGELGEARKKLWIGIYSPDGRFPSRTG